jgi:hypothetical protein
VLPPNFKDKIPTIAISGTDLLKVPTILSGLYKAYVREYPHKTTNYGPKYGTVPPF